MENSISVVNIAPTGGNGSVRICDAWFEKLTGGTWSVNTGNKHAILPGTSKDVVVQFTPTVFNMLESGQLILRTNGDPDLVKVDLAASVIDLSPLGDPGSGCWAKIGPEQMVCFSAAVHDPGWIPVPFYDDMMRSFDLGDCCGGILVPLCYCVDLVSFKLITTSTHVWVQVAAGTPSAVPLCTQSASVDFPWVWAPITSKQQLFLAAGAGGVSESSAHVSMNLGVTRLRHYAQWTAASPISGFAVMGSMLFVLAGEQIWVLTVHGDGIETNGVLENTKAHQGVTSWGDRGALAWGENHLELWQWTEGGATLVSTLSIPNLRWAMARTQSAGEALGMDGWPAWEMTTDGISLGIMVAVANGLFELYAMGNGVITMVSVGQLQSTNHSGIWHGDSAVVWGSVGASVFRQTDTEEWKTVGSLSDERVDGCLYSSDVLVVFTDAGGATWGVADTGVNKLGTFLLPTAWSQVVPLRRAHFAERQLVVVGNDPKTLHLLEIIVAGAQNSEGRIG